jgi:hypothetical protein
MTTSFPLSLISLLFSYPDLFLPVINAAAVDNGGIAFDGNDGRSIRTEKQYRLLDLDWCVSRRTCKTSFITVTEDSTMDDALISHRCANNIS